MTRQLMTITDLDRLLFVFGETAARLANAELATIYLVDRDRGEIWSKVVLGTAAAGIAGTRAALIRRRCCRSAGCGRAGRRPAAAPGRPPIEAIGSNVLAWRASR